jgi:hypothetical protein
MGILHYVQSITHNITENTMLNNIGQSERTIYSQGIELKSLSGLIARNYTKFNCFRCTQGQ